MTRQIAWLLRPQPVTEPARVLPEQVPPECVPAGRAPLQDVLPEREAPQARPVQASVPAQDVRPVPKNDPVSRGAPVTEHALGRLPRGRRGAGPHPLPSPEAVRALPPFERLPDASIVMVGPELAQQAADEIGALSVVGFDTESKPVFVRGQAQDGPHLVQFASAERAWLFPLQDPACAQAVAGLLARPELLKVGFGLAGDRAQLLARFGVAPQGLVDLDQTYRALGYRASLGIRMAMAVTFGRYFEKSKSIGTSDWSRQPLSAAQCRYAAHDAWGAFRIYEALCAQGIDVVPPPAVAKGGALRRPRSRPRPQPSPLASARSADRRADAG